LGAALPEPLPESSGMAGVLLDGMTGTLFVSSGKGLASAGLAGCWAGFWLLVAAGFWAGAVWADAWPASDKQLNPSTAMKKLRLNPTSLLPRSVYRWRFRLFTQPCGLLLADCRTTHGLSRRAEWQTLA
jgi:hypothetical protein